MLGFCGCECQEKPVFRVIMKGVVSDSINKIVFWLVQRAKENGFSLMINIEPLFYILDQDFPMYHKQLPLLMEEGKDGVLRQTRGVLGVAPSISILSSGIEEKLFNELLQIVRAIDAAVSVVSLYEKEV